MCETPNSYFGFQEPSKILFKDCKGTVFLNLKT